MRTRRGENALSVIDGKKMSCLFAEIEAEEEEEEGEVASASQ